MDQVVYRFPKWDREADVIVVGYGAAGAATAITARDEGADVVILEKLPSDAMDESGKITEVKHSPITRVSSGLVLSPSNADDAYAYQKMMNGAYGIDDVPEEMLRVWAEMLVQGYDWLRMLKGGEVFSLVEELGSGGVGGKRYEGFPGVTATRLVQNPQGGAGLFRCLADTVGDRGARVMYSTPAKELVQNPTTKEILGVIAEHEGERISIKARRGVVLTCGGFEFNKEMQATYLRIWPFYAPGGPGNTGDGVNMALKVGADLWHMNNLSGGLGGWWPDFHACFHCDPWDAQARGGYGANQYYDGAPIAQSPPSYSAILVDRNGRRFVSETHKPYTFYWDLLRFDAEKAEFSRIPSHVIFDHKTVEKGPVAGVSGPTGPLKIYEWSHDNSKEIAKGWLRKADTISELAELAGIPTDNLEETVSNWNQYCRDGRDAELGREPSTLVPIDTPPYYEVIQWPSANTLGGARRDKNAQILDPDGNPIPRLYSSGEFGSIYGFLYQRGGNLAECIAFGRIAGKNVSGEKSW